MKVVIDSTDDWDESSYAGEGPTVDVFIPPPYPRRVTEQEHRAALIGLFGQMLEPENLSY